MTSTGDAVVSIRDLTVELGDPATSGVRIGPITLDLQPGQCLCVVGPSGAGKSTIGQALLGMLSAQGRVVGGSVQIAGRSLFDIGPEQLREVRGGLVAMVFQDPSAMLNPVRQIRRIYADVLAAHGVTDRAEQLRRSCAALTAARLEPDRALRSYPHELSGGMRQRACIGLALVNDPQVVVADEPTTALDPTAQVAIIELLAELRRRRALMVITHDFRVARRLADHVAVIAGGRVAEYGPAEQVLTAPRSEITQRLIASERPVARAGRLLSATP